MAIFMPPIFVFNLYLDYIRHKSARQESNTVVLRIKAVSGHGNFRLAVTLIALRVLNYHLSATIAVLVDD